ncbi:XkdQ/YqbQ family protein [Aminipila terrae]|uniref:YqbQ/XkdQ domain-containing protein n=1 Tax=Aminipila terrae TaxID=2697030 RepID=A0A6P1MC81_9FIRM|nr:hypothetical protein [Aminipila terrae]QHI71461.1 hypothetical protein Ami3637_02875 [Aminipila terrae]
MILTVKKHDIGSVEEYDISSMVGNVTLNSSLDTLGDQLDFEIAYSDMQYYPNFSVDTGDFVKLFDEGKKEVFIGIIISKSRSEKTQSFTCFDFAFYLNKSKIIKQFNGVRADAAIKSLLLELGVTVGTVADMPTIIKKIYYDKEVAQVLKDIIEEVTNATGVKYVMEMNEGKLWIFKDTELQINVKVKVADNLPMVDINETISNPSKKASMEDMKNSIVIYVGTDEKIKTIAEAKSDWMVKRYGLLRETISMEDKDIAQGRNIAQNKLKELCKVSFEGSVEVLGHFDLRAGRILVLNEPVTNLVGKYKIKSARHSIGKIHTTSLQLEEV